MHNHLDSSSTFGDTNRVAYYNGVARDSQCTPSDGHRPQVARNDNQSARHTDGSTAQQMPKRV